MTLALYRKYRPQSFAEVIGQEHVTEPLISAIGNGRLNHAYLFSGPRGCGKTSSARILARSLNCAKGPTPTPCGECESCVGLSAGGGGSIDVIEIDAASHGGVDDARELRERAVFAPVNSRFKIYVIDEAHMVSSAGFNALLKLVEEPPDYVMFVFATTEPEKVLPTIRSRTHHYPFRLIPPAAMRGLCEKLCAEENITVEDAVYPLVIRAGAGSARDTLSVLDQLIAGAGDEGVTYARAVSLLGVTDGSLLDEICESLSAMDGAGAIGVIEKALEAGLDPRRFTSDLLERLRDLIILNQVPEAGSTGLIDVPSEVLERMTGQAIRMGTPTLTRVAEIFHNALSAMRGTTAPRLLLELACARAVLPSVDDSAAGLLQRIDQLERRLAAGVPMAPPIAGSAPAAPTAPTSAASGREAARAAAAAASGGQGAGPGGQPQQAAGAGTVGPAQTSAAGPGVTGPTGTGHPGAPVHAAGPPGQAASGSAMGQGGQAAEGTGPATTATAGPGGAGNATGGGQSAGTASQAQPSATETGHAAGNSQAAGSHAAAGPGAGPGAAGPGGAGNAPGTGSQDHAVEGTGAAATAGAGGQGYSAGGGQAAGSHTAAVPGADPAAAGPHGQEAAHGQAGPGGTAGHAAGTGNQNAAGDTGAVVTATAGSNATGTAAETGDHSHTADDGQLAGAASQAQPSAAETGSGGQAHPAENGRSAGDHDQQAAAANQYGTASESGHGPDQATPASPAHPDTGQAPAHDGPDQAAPTSPASGRRPSAAAAAASWGDEPHPASPPAAPPPQPVAAAQSATPPPSPVPAAVPASTGDQLARVRASWEQVKQAVKDRKKTVAAFLMEATVTDVDGDTLILSFRHSFHANALSKDTAMPVFTAALAQVLGGNWRVRCEVAEAGAAPPPRPAPQRPAAPAAPPPPARFDPGPSAPMADEEPLPPEPEPDYYDAPPPTASNGSVTMEQAVEMFARKVGAKKI